MEKKPWQLAENEKEDERFDYRSIEAGGYPNEMMNASPDDDDDKDEDDDDDDHIPKEDWGDVDPQPHTGRDPMDPSGPGSAV